MYRIPAILCLLFSVLLAQGQGAISGTVVRADNGSPLAGASVFISNTSRGTVTDASGSFTLNNIPTGKYELVVSSIGFETFVYSFSGSDLPARLRVEMKLKVRELENVTVEPSVEETWEKWGRMFTESFLGSTAEASQCKISNYKQIRFRYYRRSDRLVAWADEPLKIENRALGYRISYQLEDFEVRFKERSTRYMGYALFEDMDGDKKEVRKRWQRSRDRAFYGSALHFWRSVQQNRFAHDGFRVRRMWQTPNTEKERVKEIYRQQRGLIGGQGGIRIETRKAPSDSTSRDSARYYEKIMRQPDYFEHFGDSLLTADSIFHSRTDEYVAIYFPNYLEITYLNALEAPEFLKFFNENRKAYYQRSRIWITQPTAIAVFADGGFYPPDAIFSSGYWGWGDKMANMLPYDFEPYEGPPRLKL
ncbi:MAG: carboxypeptidase-like regulatory domain-containing protein [Chitinophagaceae bacterium]